MLGSNMNQDLAKVPDSKESHWEFIDIFLFRNGEHAAPPRKFHFKYDELNSWENILKNIAQTQYGSKQSVVDLYTINGEKITTPIEIANKNFYVAVPPQDTFIPTGYKDYILKASRSREKRLGKIKKPIEDILLETAGQTAKDADTKLPTSSIANGINESENPPASQDKNVTAIKMLGQILQKTHTNSPKTSTNSQLPKKSNQPPVIVTKAPLKKPDNSSKKNLKVSSGRIFNKDPVPTNLNNSHKAKGKEISRLGKLNSLINTLKKVETHPETLNEVKYTPTIIDENNVTAESPIIDDVIYDKELIVVKNPDSIIIDANKGTINRPIVTLSDIPSIMLEENKPEEKSTTNVTFNKAENVEPEIAVYNVQTNPNKDKLGNYNSIDNTGSQTINGNSKNDDIQATDNILAIIDKGDVVHFNLKLELKKCDGVIRAQYSTENQVHSVTEKQSQLKKNSIFGLLQETKANITKEVQIDDKNAKIIIVSCSCCGNENFNEIFHKIETSGYPDGNKYVVLVYDPENEENVQSFTTTLSKKSDNTDVTRLSVVDELEKVKAETSIIKMSVKTKTENGTDVEKQAVVDIKTSRTQFILRNNPSGKDEQVMTNETQNDGVKDKSIKQNNPSGKDEPVITKKTQNEGIKDKSMKSTVNSEHSNTTEIEIQNTESFNLRKNDSNIIMTKQFMDNSTQTEWSSLLLEVKRHEDGRYSFHIPPLSVLKYYFW